MQDLWQLKRQKGAITDSPLSAKRAEVHLCELRCLWCAGSGEFLPHSIPLYSYSYTTCVEQLLLTTWTGTQAHQLFGPNYGLLDVLYVIAQVGGVLLAVLLPMLC